MKHLLLTTIAAVLLAGCGPSETEIALKYAKAILLTLVLIIVVFVAPVFLMVRYEKKRTSQLAGIASDLKLSFNFQESIWEGISFGIFNYGGVQNMMHGEVDNAEFAIFDHKYKTSGSGDNPGSTYKQTAIYFKSTNLKLPRFTLSPEDLWDKIGSAFGNQDIDFPTHPDFSKRFLLRGEDETKIRALFTDKLLNFFNSQQNITVEGGCNQLILYRDEKRISPPILPDYFFFKGEKLAKEWQNFIDQGFQFFDEFVGSD
jgi:hypothetical protein